MNVRAFRLFVLLGLLLPALARAASGDCVFVKTGYGLKGQIQVRAETVATGLEVPWSILFIGNGKLLVTERAGRLRLVQNGILQPDPVATIATAASGEGGLLGLTGHPEFASNRLFYLYYTANENGGSVNRIERWRLSRDSKSASVERLILDKIPAARYHNGGRLRFGPDRMLYIGTGDATKPQLSQDPQSPAGKLLRLTPEGRIPEDNPIRNSAAFVTGIRNSQGFDWPDEDTVWITDHGPTGEMGRRGHDEINVARGGNNLGWPRIYGCQSQQGMVQPVLTWDTAVPPGGAIIYNGDAIPQWKGSLLAGTLDSEHLHRVVFHDAHRLRSHEVYFENELGRLRDVVTSPDGFPYVTTSNCDGRGKCPPEKDKLLRITPG